MFRGGFGQNPSPVFSVPPLQNAESSTCRLQRQVLRAVGEESSQNVLKSPADRVRKVSLAAVTFFFILLKEQQGTHFQRDFNSSFCLGGHC